MNKKHKSISYAKWGYVFIIPFFIVYAVCSLIPMFMTIYNSFFDVYTTNGGLGVEVTEFVGFQNYIELFTPTAGKIVFLDCTANTLIMWIMGAIPQIAFALILAVIFTSARLKIKGQAFFKTVMYMPNLIMASAFGMLFFTLFSPVGPISQIIQDMGGAKLQIFNDPWGTRCVIALINFIMWFGNTTILLMAGIMGIDQSLFEAASIDGANSRQVFFKITLPLLMPIIVYVLITALIGGLQMYDVPLIIAGDKGGVGETARTLVMYLQTFIGRSKQYGMAGAVSVLMTIVTGVLSIIVFRTLEPSKKKGGKK